MPAQSTPTTRLAPLRRPSGAFAMLAIDQREALRRMLAEHQSDPVTDAQLVDFKLLAARLLTPDASAVLIDRQFALAEAIEQRVVAPTCGLIGSADHFESAHGELVGRVTIDRHVEPGRLREQGAAALKLLVLYRPDSGSAERIDMVGEFIEMCHAADLASIVEPVSRKPLDESPWSWHEGVFAAADELGRLGADLYKAEVPFHGEAPESDLRAACRHLTSTIASEWVVLSSGVDHATFPGAVRIACEEGASGFLAGRAVWAASLSAPDIAADLSTHALARLRRLGEVVDGAVQH